MPSNPTPDVAAPGAGSSLKHRAARGAAVTVGSQLISQVLRLGSNLILTRLLFPEAFGLMAIVNMVLGGLQMISNVGIAPAIVRHDRGDEEAFLNTGWTLASIRGLLLWGVGCAAAIPVARLYGHPELVWILPASTFAAVLMGLLSSKMITLTRHITLERGVVIDLSAQVLGLVVMVGIAVQHKTVWALVIGGLAAALARTVLSHVLLPGARNRFQWEPGAAREIFSFGKWIFVSTLFTFIALRTDVALLGKLLPLGMLGVYSVGLMPASMVRNLFGRLTQSVLMPALAASQRDSNERLAENFHKARQALLPLALIAVCATAAVAPAFFETLYDERYHEASWVAQLAMLSLWFSMLQESSGRALLALGESRKWALSNVVRTLATIAGCVAGFQLGELPGLMLGAAAGAACGYAAVAVRLSKLGLSVVRLDALFTVSAAALGLTTAVAPHWIAAEFGIESVPAVGVALAVCVYLPAAAWTARQVLSKLRS